MVAAQAFSLKMQGQRHAAMGAAQNMAATPALQEIGEAAPVEKNQSLARPGVIFAQRIGQVSGDESVRAGFITAGCFRLRAQINKLDVGQRS
jgi:hypothetical protein